MASALALMSALLAAALSRGLAHGVVRSGDGASALSVDASNKSALSVDADGHVAHHVAHVRAEPAQMDAPPIANASMAALVGAGTCGASSVDTMTTCCNKEPKVLLTITGDNCECTGTAASLSMKQDAVDNVCEMTWNLNTEGSWSKENCCKKIPKRRFFTYGKFASCISAYHWKSLMCKNETEKQIQANIDAYCEGTTTPAAGVGVCTVATNDALTFTQLIAAVEKDTKVALEGSGYAATATLAWLAAVLASGSRWAPR